MSSRLRSKALRHLVAGVAMFDRFLAILRPVYVKNHFAGVATNEHHVDSSSALPQGTL